VAPPAKQDLAGTIFTGGRAVPVAIPSFAQPASACARGSKTIASTGRTSLNDQESPTKETCRPGPWPPRRFGSAPTKKGEWTLNHLEEGHGQDDLPTPKVPSQKSIWGKGTWTKEHVWLSGDLPPKVLHDSENLLARMLVTGQAS
jgi:hypothetical protein